MRERGDRLREGELRLLAAGLAATLLPVIPALPAWALLFAALFAAWRLIAGWRGLDHTPLGFLRLPLGIACFAGIYAQFGSFNGITPGTALLTLMLGLKLLESWKARDGMILSLLAFVLMLAVFLETQTLPVVIWLSLVGWFQVTVLLRLGRLSEPGPLRGDMGLSGRLLLQALPVALILFVLFPRVPGPLWGTPVPEPRATTGLSDSMAPGSISQLAQSDALAFRVRFTGDRGPEPGQLYWRGPVLERFDGQEWREAEQPDREPRITREGEFIEQEITLEAHGQDWLLALEMPDGELPDDSRRRADMRLASEDRVSERQRYRVRSWPDYTLDPGLPEREQTRLTRLPEDSNPQTRAMAREWQAESDGDPRALIERALEHFREEPFYYTLEPPRLGRHSMDEFLFDSRRGFCEHYAAAVTVLMRAAGIPARVVTGYAGAELNPLAGHYRVLQSNAHAWTEVWIEDEGWIRVDATTVIPPERVETTIGTQGDDGDGREGEGLTLRNLGLQLELAWDAVEARWDGWVLAYGPETQRAFLERLGLPGRDALKLAGIMIALLGLSLVTLWFVLSLKHRPARPRDPLERAWRRFETRMAKAGWPRQPAEGPADWLERLEREAPSLAAVTRPLINRFRSARYAGTSPDIDTIRQRLRQLPARRLKRLGKAGTT